MKSIVKELIDLYSQGKLRYSVMVFGTTPSVELPLTNDFTSDDDLKKFLDAVPRSDNGASLDKVLELSNKMFEESARPGARKILVVIMDKRSTSNSDGIKARAKPLGNAGVIVVPVPFGEESDPDEIANITPDKSNMVKANGSVDAKTLARTILNKAMKGESLGCAIQ